MHAQSLSDPRVHFAACLVPVFAADIACVLVLA
jgi:hypothetical protein